MFFVSFALSPYTIVQKRNRSQNLFPPVLQLVPLHDGIIVIFLQPVFKSRVSSLG